MREYTSEKIDQRFELLSQYERRCIIHFLQEAETDHVSVSDLVSHLQKQDPVSDERDKLTTALNHNHLPKLAAFDVLTLDSRSETVRYNGDELLEALLKSTPETYIPGT